MKLVKLGEVCKFFNGKAHEKKIDSNGKFVVVNSKCISSNFKIQKFSNEQLFPLFKNDIVIVMSDVPNGKTLAKCRLIEEDKKYSLNQRIACIRSDNFYIPYLLYQLDRNPYFLKFDNGENQTNLRKDDILNCPLYLPSIEEQQRIVAKLDAAFAEIDKAILSKRNSIINLDILFKSQLNSFFLDNSNNWEDTILGAHYDVRDGTHDSPKYVAQGIPLVTSKNLKKGKIDLTKIKYIKNEDYLLIKKRSGVSVGDVLMAMIGTIGNPVIVKKDNNFAIKNVALFKVKENQSSDFLKFYLNSPFVVNKMMKDAKGTTQQFVGLGYLRNFPIKVPSFEEQKKISLKIINLEKNVEILSNKYNLIINNYISLKNSLLVELLNESKAA
jgi:type I restriction enzyme, S subunit